MSLRGGSSSSSVGASEGPDFLHISSEDDPELKRVSSYLNEAYKHDPPHTETIGRFYWERPELEAQLYDEQMEATGLIAVSEEDSKEGDPRRFSSLSTGDLGIVWSKYAPWETEGWERESTGVDAFKYPDVSLEDRGSDLTVIDRSFGRPGYIFVRYIFPDSPAAHSGCVQVGDRLKSVRLMQRDIISMDTWPLINAMELIMGRPGEPVELCLERQWTAESEERKRKRLTRHVDLMNDFPELRRGLQIAAGDQQAPIGDFSSSEEEKDKKEEVHVCLIRQERRRFLANYTDLEIGVIKPANPPGVTRDGSAIAPKLRAMAQLALELEESAAWNSSSKSDTRACRGRMLVSPQSLEPTVSVPRALRARLDEAARKKTPVVMQGPQLFVSESEETFKIMEGDLRHFSGHVFLRGEENVSASGFCGRVTLGMSVPPFSEMRETAEFLRPDLFWKPDRVQRPLLCNAAGAFRQLTFSLDQNGASCVYAFHGMWTFGSCCVRADGDLSREFRITEQASINLENCCIGGGGSAAGLFLDCQASVVIKSTVIQGVQTGIGAMHSASGFLCNSTIRETKEAVYMHDCAAMRLHDCVLERSRFAVAATSSQMIPCYMVMFNVDAELEMVGCLVKCRLWMKELQASFQIRNFVDIDNTYLMENCCKFCMNEGCE